MRATALEHERHTQLQETYHFCFERKHRITLTKNHMFVTVLLNLDPYILRIM